MGVPSDVLVRARAFQLSGYVWVRFEGFCCGFGYEVGECHVSLCEHWCISGGLGLVFVWWLLSLCLLGVWLLCVVCVIWLFFGVFGCFLVVFWGFLLFFGVLFVFPQKGQAP